MIFILKVNEKNFNVENKWIQLTSNCINLVLILKKNNIEVILIHK
jgi:hypothetical protein